MSGEITRDELMAFTEASKAQAVALNDVLALVETNGCKLDKLIDKIDINKESIITSIVGFGDEKTTLNALKKDTSVTAKNVDYAKWFIAIVGLVIIIASTILRGIDNRIVMNKELQKIQILEGISK